MAQINYNSLNKKQLQCEIKKHGGKVTGTVDVLRMRAKRFRDKCACASDFPYGKMPDGYLTHQPLPDNAKEVFNDDCCICMDNITNDGFKTKCKHGFHRNCLKKWLQNDSRCPLCRTEIGRVKKKQPVAQTYVEAITGNNLLPPIQQPLIQYASRPQLQRSDTQSRQFMNRLLLDSALDQQRTILRRIDRARLRSDHNAMLVFSIQLADITRRIRRLMQ